MYQPESSNTFFEFTPDDFKLNQIKKETELPTENATENQERVSFEEKYYVNVEKIESDEIFSTKHSDDQGCVDLDKNYGIKTEKIEICDEESNVFDQDLCNNEWVDLDKKYQIKTEKIENCGEGSTIFNQDLEENLFSEGYNIEYVKLENNLNVNDVKNITNTEKSNIVAEKERSIASRKSFQCTLCSYAANMPSQIREHFRQVHSEIRSFDCPHCNYSAKRNSHLKRHIVGKHSNKSTIVNPRFKMVTKNESDAVRETSSGIAKHFCHICKKEVDPNYLETHIEIMHSNTKKCPDCDYKATSHVLKKHILFMHHPENAYRCHNCGYASLTKHNLKSHILKKHLNYFIYKCNVCRDFKTKYKLELQRHKDEHHQNPLKLFKCIHCPFTSQDSSSFHVHLRDQHEYESNLLDRLNNHINKSDFVCLVCGVYSSTNERDLNFHMSRVHAIKQRLPNSGSRSGTRSRK